VLILHSQYVFSLSGPSWSQKWSRRVSVRLHSVITLGDDEIIMLGDNGRDHIVRIYSVSKSHHEHAEAREIAETSLSSFDATTHSATLTEPNGEGKREILITNPSGLFTSVALPGTTSNSTLR
jgi:hypothetical protein